jgi:hypothetical protein
LDFPSVDPAVIFHRVFPPFAFIQDRRATQGGSHCFDPGWLRTFFENLMTLYTLSRTVVESDAPMANLIDVSDAPPWFCALRNEDHLMLAIWGGISRAGFDELDALMVGIKSAELSVANCWGGDSSVAAAIVTRLLPIRDNAKAFVRGRCWSAATHLLCACSRVEAAAESSFLLHGQSLTWTMPRAGNETISELVDQLEQGYAYLEKIMGMRISDPAKWVNGETTVSAGEAKTLGLVDSVKYLS